jgi:hypothetical protein
MGESRESDGGIFMNKTELIEWLQSEQQQWLALLKQIDQADMEIPGVDGDWSVKDVVAHLTTWHRDHVLYLDAAVKGVPAPDPPWPLEITDIDEINAWIFKQSRERMLEDVLKENEQVFDALMGIVKDFPDDIQIEVKEESRALQLGEQQFSMSYFFDHFHEEHEAQIREWLAKS